MRALVVGYGRMGGFHAKVLRDLGYEVVTVDPHDAAGADHPSLDDALRRWEFRNVAAYRPFDVAAVAVPAGALVDTAYRLAGTRKILVEKPFALDVPRAKMLAAYLKNSGSDVCVGLVERFNPVARMVRELVRTGQIHGVTHIKFTRYSDRPSFDVDLDLRLHDVDLARFAVASAPWPGSADITFDARANQPRKVRTIEITHADGVSTFDLMAHTLSPLHGLWHAFLTDGEYPTPADVIRALEVLPRAMAASAKAERLTASERTRIYREQYRIAIASAADNQHAGAVRLAQERAERIIKGTDTARMAA